MRKNYSSEGIILSRRDFGEADRTIWVYTKDRGRICLLAKGVRRPKSKKRGHLEIFSHIKFSVNASHGIDVMTETETIDSFGIIRKDLPRVSLAYYFMEVVGRLTHGQEKNEELFDHILEYLKKLKTFKQLKVLRNEFCTQTLVIMGFWPKEKELKDPDTFLEEIVERKISAIRVGKRLLL